MSKKLEIRDLDNDLLNSEVTKLSVKGKLLLVQKFLEKGTVNPEDSMSVGIDPWIFPNFESLYRRRLAIIVEELAGSVK